MPPARKPKVLTEKICPMCGRVRKVINFTPDFRAPNTWLTCCNSCNSSLTTRIMQSQGSVIAIWSVAMINNVPFLKRAWEKTQVVVPTVDPRSLFSMYYSAVKEVNSKYNGVWDSDCWFGAYLELDKDDEEEELAINSLVDNNTINVAPEDIENLSLEWGRFVNDNGEIDYSAYNFLLNRYNEYTADLTGLTSAMSMQFRNLCKAEWQKIKADEIGDIAAIDRSQKLINGLLSALKMDDFAVEKSDTDRFIDRLIWRIEETEPAEEEDREKYKDIAGYEDMYNSIMRSMRNMIAGTRDYPDVPVEEV